MPRSRLAALVATVMVLLSGCRIGSAWGGNGIAKLPPLEILATSKAAAAATTSVHVQGRLVAAGQPVSIDMRVTRGQVAAGVISMGPHTIELVRSGPAVYVKGSDGFYQSLGIRAMPLQLKGKYLKVQVTDREFVSLAGFTDIKRVFDLFLASPPSLTKTKKRKINGLRAIGLVDRGAGGRTLYVALQGEPLPLQITTGGAGQTINFLEYNQPVSVIPPAPATVVDIGLLTKAAA